MEISEECLQSKDECKSNKVKNKGAMSSVPANDAVPKKEKIENLH